MLDEMPAAIAARAVPRLSDKVTPMIDPNIERHGHAKRAFEARHPVASEIINSILAVAMMLMLAYIFAAIWG